MIGLTGNIACGKSTVIAMLQELGARTIDADRVAHQLMAAGTPVWRSIVDEFGEGVLLPSGEIDRRKLGGVVFSDPALLRKLEFLTHPAVKAEVLRLLKETAEPIAVVDAIKLIESSMTALCNALWVVTCRPEQQLERLVKHRGLTEDQAKKRIEAQPLQSAKICLARVVIDNSGSVEQTREQVQRAWEEIVKALEEPEPTPASDNQ
ncbi:MAG: dephospho-CoA kinase [Chloroflexi bacterium]|nr:dephospho-CoA kinase [Chloroflexota bacterium]